MNEIQGDSKCTDTQRKYGVAKNAILHWIKLKQKVFEAVEEHKVSKQRKWMKTATYEGGVRKRYILMFIETRVQNS